MYENGDYDGLVRIREYIPQKSTFNQGSEKNNLETMQFRFTLIFDPRSSCQIE